MRNTQLPELSASLQEVDEDLDQMIDELVKEITRLNLALQKAIKHLSVLKERKKRAPVLVVERVIRAGDRICIINRVTPWGSKIRAGDYLGTVTKTEVHSTGQNKIYFNTDSGRPTFRYQRDLRKILS